MKVANSLHCTVQPPGRLAQSLSLMGTNITEDSAEIKGCSATYDMLTQAVIAGGQHNVSVLVPEVGFYMCIVHATPTL